MPTNTLPVSSCSIVRRVAFDGNEISSAYSRSRVRTSRRAGHDRLAHRVEHDAVDLAQRALRLGIEPAQRLDLVAEQLDPHRMRRERRVDIDDAAAQRERAGLVDDRRPRPAAVDQELRDLIAIDRAGPSRSRGRARASSAGGMRLARERLGRGDHDPRPQRRAGSGDTASRRARRCSCDRATAPRTARHRCRAATRSDRARPSRRRADPEPDIVFELARGVVVGCDHDDELGRRALGGEPRGPAGRRAVRDDRAAIDRLDELCPHYSLACGSGFAKPHHSPAARASPNIAAGGS